LSPVPAPENSPSRHIPERAGALFLTPVGYPIGHPRAARA
jgi:hypothetical protein